MDIRPVAILTVLGLGLLATPADAQYARRGSSVSHPSQNAASTSLGGRYTRSTATAPLNATRADVATLGRNEFQFSRGRTGSRSPALPVARVGLYRPLAIPQGQSLSNTLYRTGDLSLMAGVGAARSLNVPAQIYRNQLPSIRAHQFTPRATPTRFHELTGLQPIWVAPPPPDEPFEPIAVQLDARTDKRGERALAEGIALFESATVEMRDPRTGRYPNCRDCPARLAEASRALQLAREIDEDASLASLLMVHIALEQERPTLAAVYLLEAYERDPDMLTEDPAALHQYFGDVSESGTSTLLRRQMQRYQRLGELNAGAVSAHLLGAYCAWRLGDTQRTLEVVDLAEELMRGDDEVSPRMVNFARALRTQAP
jgi:hypothetical protein